MRVAPVALFAYPDQDRAAQLAAQAALITHTHPEAIDGAVIQAVAVTAILATTGPVDPSPLIRRLIDHVHTPVFRDKLEFAGRHLGLRPLTEIAAVLGTGIAAHASVVTALTCFLTHPQASPTR